MYIKDDSQAPPAESGYSSGFELNPENRWVKMSDKVDWNKTEEKYGRFYYADGGVASDPARLALCSMIIKKTERLTDEKLIQHIQENPYMRHFCGINENAPDLSFLPDLMAQFSEQFGDGSINETISGIIRVDAGGSVDLTLQPDAGIFGELRVKTAKTAQKINPAYLTDKNVYAARLKEHIFSEPVISAVKGEIAANTGRDDLYVVFISVCGKRIKASVASGTGNTLESAWEKADKEAAVLTRRKKIDARWLKADIINNYKKIRAHDLNGIISGGKYQNYFRGGISFDEEFRSAFLESELNSSGIIDYSGLKEVKNGEENFSGIPIDEAKLNEYADKYRYKAQISEIPPEITVFTTLSYFCGEGDNLSADGEVFELYSDGLSAGRRITPIADGDYINRIMINAENYLHGLIEDDGRFVYGYRPKFNRVLKGYSILRHAGSIWSLIYLYSITRDENLISKIDAAIEYLKNFFDYVGADAAFVAEPENKEVKLGGNGLAVIMLTEYMNVMKTDRYVELVRKLANGMLYLQNEGGAYYHVLNWPEYTGKDEFRIIYFDGEATFALTRAYAFTKDEKYLNAAQRAVKNFIRNDYTKYHDHWVSYSLNELTQYVDDVRYYEFALKNAANNFDRVNNSRVPLPTSLEMLMCVWRTCERARERAITSEYIDNFDMTRLAESIYALVQRHLNGYFYPEFAMYVARPQKFVNSYFVRTDGFRIRIDDIQHFFGGYYFYVVYYNQIRPYLSDEFLAKVNSEERFFSFADKYEIMPTSDKTIEFVGRDDPGAP